MIPRDFITEWRAYAPWVDDAQVEQDLVIARALVELFRRPVIARALAFRGGTALNKLHFRPAARYSEDIDLVQVESGPIGPVFEAIHDVLDRWLGEPKWKQSEGRATLTYRFNSEDSPPRSLKLKVEINTREHFSVYGHERVLSALHGGWRHLRDPANVRREPRRQTSRPQLHRRHRSASGSRAGVEFRRRAVRRV